MRVLHIANGEAGAAAASVAALKVYSKHQHEIVARWASGINKPLLVEETTTPETVIELAQQADLLHFHGLGYAGAVGNPCTIHGLDWSDLVGYKPSVFHGTESLLTPEGKYILPGGDRYRVDGLDKFRGHFGAYPSCAEAYAVPGMEYLPNILTLQNWLLGPLSGWLPSMKQRRIATMKIRKRCKEFQDAGLPIDYLDPAALLPSENLRARRNEYVAALDNYSDGHWTDFGLESLAQGVPCAVHISENDQRAFETLGAGFGDSPFVALKYGGADTFERLKDLVNRPGPTLDNLAEYGRFWMFEFYNPTRLASIWDAAYDKLDLGF